jgi:hypothetical protein
MEKVRTWSAFSGPCPDNIGPLSGPTSMPLTRIFILRPWWIAYEEPSASMSVRPAASNELLTTKQRLCVFHNTELSAEKALALSEEDMNDTLLTSHAVKAENLAAAGVGPRTLKRMGVPDAASLRKMGFDSLYLTDSKFAAEANAAFGAEAVVDAFLMSASDAVAIAGSDAVGILGISTTDLLDACAGAPVEAASVLQQLPHGLSLVAKNSCGSLRPDGLCREYVCAPCPGFPVHPNHRHARCCHEARFRALHQLRWRRTPYASIHHQDRGVRRAAAHLRWCSYR